MNYFNELINALEKNDETEAIDIVKNHGKEFNKYQDYKGNTIATFAIKKNLQRFINYILRDEVLINMPDCYGNSPLHLCINRNYDMLALQFLKENIEVNIPNNNGDLALELAMKAGYQEVAKEILKKPKGINLILKNGNTPLLMALELDMHEIAIDCINNDNSDLEYINKNINAVTYGETALTYAIKKNAIEESKLIIKKDKTLNIPDSIGNTPLFLCIIKSLENVGRLIIERSVDLNYKANKETALTLSIKKEMHGIADSIVTKGQSLEISDGYNKTPLGLAIERGFEKLSIKLIKGSQNLNVLVTPEETALTLSIKREMYSVADEIVSKGQIINIVNKNKEIPFELALNKNFDTLVNKMISKNLLSSNYANDRETYVTYAIKKGKANIVKSLIESGAKLGKNRLGESPLELSTYFKMPHLYDLIKQNIIKQGLESDIKTKEIKPNINFENVKEQVKNYNAPVPMTEQEKEDIELHKKLRNML